MALFVDKGNEKNTRRFSADDENYVLFISTFTEKGIELDYTTHFFVIRFALYSGCVIIIQLVVWENPPSLSKIVRITTCILTSF